MYSNLIDRTTAVEAAWNAFHTTHHRAPTIREIATETGVPPSSVHRYCTALLKANRIANTTPEDALAAYAEALEQASTENERLREELYTLRIRLEALDHA